jgi:hypothetical protein
MADEAQVDGSTAVKGYSVGWLQRTLKELAVEHFERYWTEPLDEAGLEV